LSAKARSRRRTAHEPAGIWHRRGWSIATHLDKTLTGLPWMGHSAGPTRMSRIETDKTILPRLPVSTEEQRGRGA
jgi:hypothetical protein